MLDSMFYTPAEVAALLKVNRITVLRWIKAGKLQAANLGGRTIRPEYRVSESALKAFLGIADDAPAAPSPSTEPPGAPLTDPKPVNRRLAAALRHAESAKAEREHK